MKIVIELSREDLIAALNAGQPVKAEVSAPSKPKASKPAKAVAVEEDFDETEEEEAPAPKPVKKAKPAKVTPPPVEEDDEADDEEETESDDEADEEEETESDDEEFITGEDLAKLKKALNAHKAAQGGKPKKTLEILRKFAPGGSEKVKPDVLPKLLKALKV